MLAIADSIDSGQDDIHPQLPFVRNSEAAGSGTVVGLGDGIATLRVGDRVETADAVGADAEYCFASANVVTSVPDGAAPTWPRRRS
jgi:NADPH:quinone reductase-like Zn-dependent oxidoreductase